MENVLKEVDKRVVVLEVIYYGTPCKIGHTIDEIEQIVTCDGDIEYRCRQTSDKWLYYDTGPVRTFERWLFNQQPKYGSDVSGDRGKPVSPVGKRRFKGFNFKPGYLFWGWVKKIRNVFSIRCHVERRIAEIRHEEAIETQRSLFQEVCVALRRSYRSNPLGR